jgi:hypothetical protein
MRSNGEESENLEVDDGISSFTSVSFVKAPQGGADDDGVNEDEVVDALDSFVSLLCQVELARRAATENLIVHLEKGMGKMLVVILAMERHRWTVWVVPTVELVVSTPNLYKGTPSHPPPRSVCVLDGSVGSV